MYSVTKDGINYIVEDRRKEEFEKKGYEVKLYIQPVEEIKKPKTNKPEEQ